MWIINYLSGYLMKNKQRTACFFGSILRMKEWTILMDMFNGIDIIFDIVLVPLFVF